MRQLDKTRPLHLLWRHYCSPLADCRQHGYRGQPAVLLCLLSVHYLFLQSLLWLPISGQWSGSKHPLHPSLLDPCRPLSPISAWLQESLILVTTLFIPCVCVVEWTLPSVGMSDSHFILNGDYKYTSSCCTLTPQGLTHVDHDPSYLLYP